MPGYVSSDGNVLVVDVPVYGTGTSDRLPPAQIERAQGVTGTSHTVYIVLQPVGQR